MVANSAVTGSAWPSVTAPAAARATEWVEALRAAETAAAATPLGGIHRDPEGFDFTRRLLEQVAGTDDAFASATGLREMAQEAPATMSVRDRIAMRAGGAASLGLPWAIMPVARRWLRNRLGHLVLATKLPDLGSSVGFDPSQPAVRLNALAEALRRQREAGLLPVLQPLGDAVHGPDRASGEAARLAALAAHPAVTHLIVDPARLAPGGSDWSAEDDATRLSAALRPVLEAAVEHETTILLEPRSVRWARLIPDALARAFADPALDRVRVGTRLIAELPESRELYDRLSRWAQRRVAEGGAPAEIVIGVSGVAGAERIASIQNGLAVPVLEDRGEVAAQLLRLVELALHPGRAAVLRPIVASEDPLVLAAAIELAAQLGSSELMSVQLRSGVVLGLAERVASGETETRIVMPVVTPREFAGAVPLLVGIAAEAADPASAVGRLERLLSAPAATEGSQPAGDPEPEAGEPAGRGQGKGSDPDPELESDSGEGAAQPSSFASMLGVEMAALEAAAALAAEPAPVSHRTQLRAHEWDPSERDSALFYRAPDEPARFDTGGLTAAVLGLGRGATGAFALEELLPPRAIPAISDTGFANEPATDASIPANREWLREQIRIGGERAVAQDSANETVALSAADLDPDLAAQAARDSGERWSQHGPTARAVRLRRAALAVVAARDRLLQSLAADTGAPAAELDAEINDIVDAARYSGQLAEGLGSVRGATFVPSGLALVTADLGTPISLQVEAVLAALGAGSSALWAVPQRVHATAAALLEEWEIGGLTPGAVRLEAVAVDSTVVELAAHHEIDRAIVLGDRSTGRELARRRPDLRIEGHFRSRGSVLVTPSADLDQVVTDVVASAFAAAGSDPRTAHALILLGSVGRSRRFRAALADAVRALRVGDTARPASDDPLSFDIGPLPNTPSAAQLRALSELGRGEEWLVQPRQIDEHGLLWSPGVRLGVDAASGFWDDALGVPVLGIATAHTLGEALALQNAAGSGSVAALHSNDADEILAWTEGISAAALSVNRPTTATLTERHPGGGWDDAVMGLPALSGGPNRLLPLGSWQPREGTRSDTLHLRGLDAEVQLLISAAQPTLGYEEFDAVRRAALADALVWRTAFGVERDTIGLGIERNVLRYRPVVTQVRLAEGGSVAALVRVLAAALLVRAPIALSTGELLPLDVAELVERQGISVSLERDDDWMERIAVSGPLGPADAPASRVRLIGGDATRVAEWMGGLDRAALWAEPVTMAGPVELLTLLREQSISARANRHGLAIPVPGLDELLGGRGGAGSGAVLG